MKNILISISFLLFLSCRNSRAMTTNPIDRMPRQELLDDSILQYLQKNNELVLAFAVETYAWAKTKNYQILALNNNEWRGYHYIVNNTSHTSSGLMPADVSNDSCNALWKLITEKEASKIEGDNGKDFCSGEKRNNCNINDGVTWRLYFIKKNNMTDLSYYEPEYYENCCPGNSNRQLFLQIANKIKSIIGNNEKGLEQ